MLTLGLTIPDGLHRVVKACAHPLQDCRQQPLGAFQTALACFGNTHGQGACDVGLLLERHSGAEALVRPYLQGECDLHSATFKRKCLFTLLYFDVLMSFLGHHESMKKIHMWTLLSSDGLGCGDE